MNETPWRLAHHNGTFAVLTEFDIDEVKCLGDGDHNRHKLPASLQGKTFKLLTFCNEDHIEKVSLYHKANFE